MAEKDSFFALVHRDGEIKHSSREGVKFTGKNPTNVFITTRTHLADLQRSSNVRSAGWKAAFGNDILSHSDFCCGSGGQVRTTELFVEMLAPLASSGGSVLNPHYANIAGPSHRVIQHDSEAQQVVSPTFDIYNEPEAGDYVGELGDIVTAAPHALTIPAVQREANPLVDEALRPDDSDDEPPFIDGDSDDEWPGSESAGRCI
ncbi:hypothetical protein PIB30_045099 [Stylosanthes scabra]|uniref:Uncharacterized protein n=1 Tax=Stylosanthes scabra TaxID=79078 RepID=A0ABU6ZEU1_9FABA|nr:hypothetical protein [Stylosanthes scabra]